jgi:hypothetical protein
MGQGLDFELDVYRVVVVVFQAMGEEEKLVPRDGEVAGSAAPVVSAQRTQFKQEGGDKVDASPCSPQS